VTTGATTDSDGSPVGPSGPMAGIKVVEIGVWVAGPAAAGILADWGASVIKVEPPSGDPSRLFHAMLGGDLPTNPVFELDNRSKRSVALDLAKPEAREIICALIDQADVFVSNLRPGALERLGLDPETLMARNPRLVYCSISGYGLNGEDRDRAAFDIGAYWARSGIADLLTPEGGMPPYQRGGMGDHPTGMSGAAAISAALFHRERTGQGQLVSTSLLRQGMYTVGFDMNLALGWGRVPAKAARATMASPTVNHYASKDGRRFWLIGLQGARHWPSLCRAVGREAWIDDERFATPVDRAQNAAVLTQLLDAEFAEKTLEEWAAIFADDPEMFWAPVQTVDDVLGDPQTWAAGAYVDVPGPDGPSTMVATPVDFSGTPWAPRGHAPDLGEHTREVLEELGYDEARITELYDAGIAVTRPWFG
jgi:crotonobetainyl-CoA:carnitine CoA-transferase CaiB-like acyl-CoA transferase